MPYSQQQYQSATRLDSIQGNDPSQLIFQDELSAIENIGGAFIERVKNNIEQADMIVTGRIDDIITQRTEVGFDILANNYLLYQDRGITGTSRMPPVDAIREWIIAKNIPLTTDIDSAAFAIAQKIFHEGFRPRNVFQREIPQMADDLASAMGNLVVNILFNGNPL